jgi:L,D-peptidoglycan transpeptidase YkuD (ErfK/YbiS/YcfS/YnhG family)
VQRRLVVLAVTVAVLLGGLAGLAAGPAAATTAATTSRQVVTVSAPSATSTFATVEAWSRQADGRYKRVASFPDARIGAQGMGPTSETQSRTPTGQFPLSQAFGIKPNPGVHTTYFRVGPNDVWTGSTGSVINQHRRCAPNACPASYGGYERLSAYPGPYDYGVFIGYNAAAPYGAGAVPGAGSAFFLHVKNAYATGGCVAVAADQMVWLLRWFRTASAPIISIGLGADAYAPIPNRYA